MYLREKCSNHYFKKLPIKSNVHFFSVFCRSCAFPQRFLFSFVCVCCVASHLFKLWSLLFTSASLFSLSRSLPLSFSLSLSFYFPFVRILFPILIFFFISKRRLVAVRTYHPRFIFICLRYSFYSFSVECVCVCACVVCLFLFVSTN